jgi:polyhydroxybutyrate depolymerase
MEHWTSLLAPYALLVFAVALASCGSSPGSTSSIGASLGCANGTLDTGVTHVDLDFGGTGRSYELHVPPSYDGATPAPLVLNFHGLTQTGNAQRSQSHMDDKADQEGYIVAYPNGIDNAWNSGGNPANEVDDVGFTRAVIDDLGVRGCIDLKRVYATGMSNGGGMSHRLACEAADVIAAVAPSSGQLALAPSACTPQRPIPLIHFHGQNDTIASYEGVPEMVQAWADRNGCTDEPRVTYQEGDVTCETTDQCDGDASVTLCAAEEAGHCWFGYPCPPEIPIDLGGHTTSINANDAMWDLFTRTTLP